MRFVVYLVLMALMCEVVADSPANLEHRSMAVDSNVIVPILPLTKEERRERRKERRLLRKKKQRMRELREEIRILTLSLQQTNSTVVLDKTEAKLKQKNRQGRKGVKWRKNLLENLKGIVRRLDRMERRLVESNQQMSSEILHSFSTADISSSTPTTYAPPPPVNEAIIQKLKRIQPAISRSRSGENGTACTAHKDCRPGHCCHRLIGKDTVKSICVLHRLAEEAECVDGCQCSTQLNCFLPDRTASRNTTNAYCKKAASSDILVGTYLYQKDTVIVDSGSN